jgi:hypothetical protein
MKEITENDLIIGAKYNIPEYERAPYIYFGSINGFGFISDSHLIFINCYGDIIKLSSNEIIGITQFHEPVEKSIDMWIVYIPDKSPEDNWVDKLTNLHTDGCLYGSEEVALENMLSYEEIKKINVTVKY